MPAHFLLSLQRKRPDFEEHQEGIILNSVFPKDFLLENYGHQGKHLDSGVNVANTDLNCQNITIVE